jgi:hypothetical protein
LPSSRPASEDHAGPQSEVRRLVRHHIFGSAAAAATLVALLLVFLSPGLSAPGRSSVVLALCALAALAALSMRVRGMRVEHSVLVLSVATLATVALSTVMLGWGVSAPGMGFFALLTVTVCAVSGRRAGWGIAILSALTVLAIAAAQHAGSIVVPGPPLPLDKLALHVLVHLCAVFAGLAGGMAMSAVVSRYLRSSKDRERRFGGLVAIAAVAFW